jgi:hypothetical protein
VFSVRWINWQECVKEATLCVSLVKDGRVDDIFSVSCMNINSLERERKWMSF